MELRHLRYFVAVAEALSFSRAAISLHVAQPSLSTQIRDLENELGLTLLHRDRTRVALTDAGAVFLREARQVLARAETAVKRAREAAEGQAGTLRVATMGPLTFSFLPACLTRFRAGNPGVRVTVSEMAPSEQLERIARGEIHAGFVPAPFPRLADAKRLTTTKILRSPLVMMMAPEHPCARPSGVRLRDLADETFLHIRLYGIDAQRIWTQEVCRKAGFQPRFGAGAVNPENLIGMVAAGEGIALIPMIAQRAPAPGCAYIPILEKNLPYELLAVSNPRLPSALTERFLKIVAIEAAATERELGKVSREEKRQRRTPNVQRPILKGLRVRAGDLEVGR